MNVRRKFVDGEYGQIHLRVAANGCSDDIPLVCLHQSPKSGREFARFMEIAGAHRQIIAPDYPGYGESSHPPDDVDIGVVDYARAIWQAVDQLALGKVDLFGNHTGSMVAAEMTKQRPDDVRHIAMISASILSEEEARQFNRQFLPVPLDEAGTRFTHMWEMISKHRSAGTTLEMMATSFAENLRGGEQYERGHYAAFAYAPEFGDVIASLPHRIIVFNPADMLYEYTNRVIPLLQNGVVVPHPEWAHEVLNVHPEALWNAFCDAAEGEDNPSSAETGRQDR